MRNELKIGILAMALSLTLDCFLPMPELVMGFLLGIALCFELIGSLPQAAYEKLKAVKRRLFRRS